MHVIIFSAILMKTVVGQDGGKKNNRGKPYRVEQKGFTCHSNDVVFVYHKMSYKLYC